MNENKKNYSLDDIEFIQKIDKSEMYSSIRSSGKNILSSYLSVKESVQFSSYSINKIVASGMGGSGFAPLVISSLYKAEMVTPFILSQDYDIPSFVDSNTLLIAISNSGETEEVISQYYKAKSLQAKIFIIGQGSRLIEIAKKDNIPYYNYTTKVPSRTSFPFMFGSCLACLENSQAILNNFQRDFREAIKINKKLENMLGIFNPIKDNDAKKIAIQLKTKIPILYIEPPFNSLGPIFAKMMNENSKKFSFFNYFPEIRHNEIMVWTSKSLDKSKFIPIIIRDNEKYSSMEKEIDKILTTFNCDIIQLRAIGQSKTARFLSLLYLLTMISFYQAILIKKDPSSTPKLKQLKKSLRISKIIPYA